MSKFTGDYEMDILFELIKYELDMCEPKYNLKEIEYAVNNEMFIVEDPYNPKKPLEIDALYSKFSDRIPFRSFLSILKDLDGGSLKLIYVGDCPRKVKITRLGIHYWKHYHRTNKVELEEE